MDLLVVAATEAEIAPLSAAAREKVDILVTGVGMVATTYALTRRLATRRYDAVLQAGVAGSFDPGILPGDLVLVATDQFADLGAEDHDNYLDIFEMGLLAPDQHPFAGGRLHVPESRLVQQIALPQVSGLTINTVSGSAATIQKRAARFGAQVESMEGAAFHYVCLQEGVSFAQVRAISNYVTPRDKSRWKMKEAIVNLNRWLEEIIHVIHT